MDDLVGVIGRAGLGAQALPASDSRARRMMLAAQKLAEPSRSLYDRLFIKGEPDEVVQKALNMTRHEFNGQRTSMLRALMSASQ